MLMVTLRLLLAGALVLPMLSACAVNGDPRDPLEPMNRAIYRFNEKVDDVALEPLAKGYVAVTPKPVRSAVRNFFSNLDDVVVFANNALQLKGRAATSDFLRVVFNSTLGFAGLLDIASEMGLPKHDEDFGQTLGHWGVTSGPYFVMPLLGPSTIRDSAGWLVDGVYLDPAYQLDDTGACNATVAVRVVSHRAELLDAKRAIDIAALDPYEFSRDLYFEHRAAKLRDGRPAPADD